MPELRAFVLICNLARKGTKMTAKTKIKLLHTGNDELYYLDYASDDTDTLGTFNLYWFDQTNARLITLFDIDQMDIDGPLQDDEMINRALEIIKTYEDCYTFIDDIKDIDRECWSVIWKIAYDHAYDEAYGLQQRDNIFAAERQKQITDAVSRLQKNQVLGFEVLYQTTASVSVWVAADTREEAEDLLLESIQNNNLAFKDQLRAKMVEEKPTICTRTFSPQMIDIEKVELFKH